MADTDARLLFDDVLSRAIPEICNSRIDLFTFAFYHDHESGAVSVCADTETSSARLVQKRNAFSAKHFANAVASGDLKKAKLFRANVGRSDSLGDFELVNVARTGIGSISVDADFYLNMIRAVQARESEIVMLTKDAGHLLFCSSSETYEVEYMWTAAKTSGNSEAT